MLQFIIISLLGIINNYQILDRFYNSALDYKKHNIFLEGLNIKQKKSNFLTRKVFSINDYINNISCF